MKNQIINHAIETKWIVDENKTVNSTFMKLSTTDYGTIKTK